jgi:hypothetical protein
MMLPTRQPSGNYLARYSATRSLVHVATTVPKKSASCVHIGQPSIIAQAKTGQSSASRMAII